jgi:hypothetical protein
MSNFGNRRLQPAPEQARHLCHQLIANRDLWESPSPCHSEGAERPKNLKKTRKCEILRFAQDDKIAFRRGLESV